MWGCKWDPIQYRPQRSCDNVMFSQASEILFTGGGGGVWQTPTPSQTPPLADTPSADTPTQILPWTDSPPPRADTPSTPLGRHTTHPLGRHPLARHPPPSSRQLLQQTVRILLECILVHAWFCPMCRFIQLDENLFILSGHSKDPLGSKALACHKSSLDLIIFISTKNVCHCNGKIYIAKTWKRCYQSVVLNFHAVFRKIWPNNRLATLRNPGSVPTLNSMNSARQFRENCCWFEHVFSVTCHDSVCWIMLDNQPRELRYINWRSN